jgi:hypothetical protein
MDPLDRPNCAAYGLEESVVDFDTHLENVVCGRVDEDSLYDKEMLSGMGMLHKQLETTCKPGPDIDDRRRNRCRCRHGHRRCLAIAYGDGVTLCYRCDGGCVCNCRSCNPRGPRHGIIVELKQHFLLKASLTDLSLPLHDTEAAAFCSQALPINCLFAKPVLHKRAPLHLDGCARASRHNFPFLQKRLEAFEKLLSTTNEDRAL